MSSELDAAPARDALLFSPDDERQHVSGRSETEERSPRARRMARFESGLEFPVGMEARRFSNVLPVKAAKECLEVRYRRSRWSKVDYEGSDDVRARITDGIIMVEGERAGRIQFTEFRLGTFVNRREFWRTMDDASAEISALAEVINEAWEEPTDIAAYGDIVELKRVWIRPSLTGKGRLDAVSDTMLTELFESRALLILKAFPLEYEGAVAPDNEAMFKRRQAAMMRRYSAMLGVQPLPGKNGQEGWMYGVPARLADIIQRPATWAPPRADEDW